MRLGGKLNSIWLFPPGAAFLVWLATPGEIAGWPFCFIALLPVFIFLEKARAFTKRQLFLAGLLFGIPLYLLQMYWIVNVLAEYGGLPFFLAAGALFLLSFYMALYPALFFLFGRAALLRFPVLLNQLLLPACWVGLDWVRGHVFTGFPWMDFGYTLAFHPALIQLADIFGHSGVTWMLVFINFSLWIVLFSKNGLKNKLLSAALFVTLSLLAFVYNTFQLNHLNKLGSETVRMEIVQGNIPQEEKWSGEMQGKTLLHYLHLTAQQALIEKDKPFDLTVWPETAMPFYANASILSKELKNFVRASGIAVLTGAPWYEIVTDRPETYRFYNAALLLSPKDPKLFSGYYFKSHLVPFGEYVPLQKLLFFLGPLVETAGNFSAGVIAQPLSFETSRGIHVKMGVLICFESVFPDLSRKWSEKGANLLMNLTNDAWYGRSSAPWHSLAMTVFRAVENRRAIVRSANTGFSALILPTGEIRQRSSLFKEDVISVQPPLLSCITLFVKYGHFFAPFCLVVSMVAVFLLWQGNGKQRGFLCFPVNNAK